MTYKEEVALRYLIIYQSTKFQSFIYQRYLVIDYYIVLRNFLLRFNGMPFTDRDNSRFSACKINKYNELYKTKT